MRKTKQYDENERLVMLKHLDTFGLNPFAFWKMMESYFEHVHPLPVRYDYQMTKKDMMDTVAETKSMVELYIEPVGSIGKKINGSPKLLDQPCLNLFCRSYYEQLRPLAVSFQVGNAATIHLRTPGVPDSETINPLRDINVKNYW